jgi:hypothetical protein
MRGSWQSPLKRTLKPWPDGHSQRIHAAVTLPFASNGEWSVAIRPMPTLSMEQIDPVLRPLRSNSDAGQGVLSETLPQFRSFNFYENSRLICLEFGQKPAFAANRPFKPAW